MNKWISEQSTRHGVSEGAVIRDALRRDMDRDEWARRDAAERVENAHADRAGAAA